MKTSRLWLIAGSAALVAIVVGVTAAIIRPDAEPEASPSSPAQTATPTPTRSAEPTSTPTPDAQATGSALPEATCENTATAEFRSTMQTWGWTSTNTLGQQIGAQPFEGFPSGPPEGAVVCRWQAVPGEETDRVVDLAWAPLAAEAQADVIQTLGARGYTLTQEAEGVYVDFLGTASYLITVDDIRWGRTREDLTFIAAPPAAG